LPEAHEQLGGALGLVVGHAGHRFVEQQQLRVLHQQHADLQPLLLAVGEQPGGRSAWSARRICRRVSAMRSRSSPNRRANRLFHPLVGLQRQLEVLEHRVLLEDGGLLELAADAGVGDLGSVRRVRSMVWPKKALPRRAGSCR
jgi:hypothetical protein